MHQFLMALGDSEILARWQPFCLFELKFALCSLALAPPICRPHPKTAQDNQAFLAVSCRFYRVSLKVARKRSFA